MMTADELRESFLNYFEGSRHVRFESHSLIPHNDPSVLFTSAGMNQFKERFLGLGDRTLKRAVSAQKCLRTGDIDEVGRTGYHHSFFEMLGNFSFGDYFAQGAISYAWEYLTSKNALAIDPGRLSVSVYKDDEEAAAIWEGEIGIPSERICRRGEGENYWPAGAPSLGPNGPCGPCSEIFFDRGEAEGCGRPDCGIGCPCGRWVEIWNLVFMQFERKDGGVMAPLPAKNVDTGMGLERMLAAINGRKSNFDTELFVPIINEIARIIGREYDAKSENGVRFRRIADHARAAVFCIGDGVLPSNEGRGYVERKLLRRAFMDGRLAGVEEPFIHRLVPVIADIMRRPYPQIEHGQERIATIIRNEEEQFGNTLAVGSLRVEELIERRRAEGRGELSGEDLFVLHDTYGVPPEITEVITASKSFGVARVGYDEKMERQRELARAGSKMAKDVFGATAIASIRGSIAATEFVGYETVEVDARVLAILQNGGVVDSADGGEVTLIVDRTPFYAEAGGQLTDTGVITAEELSIEVGEVRRDGDYWLHHGVIKRGRVAKGQGVHIRVDPERRLNIQRNHTATHILHAALRTVLGTHVQQAGSLVAPDRLRFDFTHPGGLSDDQIERVEAYVNERIMWNVPLKTSLTTVEEARAAGAMALFDEKYGEKVRLVHIGDFSSELCGGTHLDRTGGIGCFVITSERAIAAGVRRIEAATGVAARELMAADARTLAAVCRLLKTTPPELVARVEKLLAEMKELKSNKSRKPSGGGDTGAGAAALLAAAAEVGGVRIVVHRLPDGVEQQQMRDLADEIRRASREKTALFIAAALSASSARAERKGTKGAKGAAVRMLAAFTADLVERGLNARDIIKEAATIVGGGGGGKPEMAEAGGKDPARLDEAVERVRGIIREALS